MKNEILWQYWQLYSQKSSAPTVYYELHCGALSAPMDTNEYQSTTMQDHDNSRLAQYETTINFKCSTTKLRRPDAGVYIPRKTAHPKCKASNKRKNDVYCVIKTS